MNKRTTSKTPSKTSRKPQAPRKTAKPAKATAADQAPAVLPKKLEVKITAAKGRPMLTWVGKRPLSQVTAFPAQLVERHWALDILGLHTRDLESDKQRIEVLRSLRRHWNAKCWEDQPGIAAPESGGQLFHGDNKEVLAHLLANGYRGKVDLIYIDPPFDSGADYVRKVSLRGAKGGAKLDGETYALGEQIQYTDIWANDNYLQFMYERLLLLKELLSDRGTLYLHCDWHRNHLLRCLLDEVMGADGFRGQVIREKCNPKNYTSDAFGNVHDMILSYSRGNNPTWNKLHDERDEAQIEEGFPKRGKDGRRYKTAPLHAPGIRAGQTGNAWRGINPPSGNHWRYVHSTLEELDAKGLIEWSDRGNPRKIVYADESEGLAVQDIWLGMKDNGGDYPTEKNEHVLERVIRATSDPGDLVLDCFIGSGTTAAVAQKLGRRWIGCDINKGAIQTTGKRLRAVISEQIAKALADKKEQAGKLPGMGENEQAGEPKPCQFGFAVWRVNDYDLQIQHNEAVNLACEHIGIQRTRTDSYFDGTLSRNLVKIVPFGHPLTPLDLEELRRELDARPDEDRGITLVCLGMELQAKTWIDDWNTLRKRKRDEHLHKPEVNRIDVIELRTDPKYGKFIEHRPGQAKVKVSRKGGRIAVEVKDFISPTIIERLQQQAGLLQPKIDDWRAMVDYVCIDTAYTGGAFNVVLADVPEKKTDFVSGQYDLPAPEGETTVAVRVTDMLGEEVLVTAEV